MEKDNHLNNAKSELDTLQKTHQKVTQNITYKKELVENYKKDIKNLQVKLKQINEEIELVQKETIEERFQIQKLFKHKTKIEIGMALTKRKSEQFEKILAKLKSKASLVNDKDVNNSVLDDNMEKELRAKIKSCKEKLDALAKDIIN